MSDLKKILLLTILLPLFPVIKAQDVTQPESPVLDILTVDPLTGNVILSWISSPSSDVESYVIYVFENGASDAIDTVKSATAVQYIHTGSAARYWSVTYLIAAVDSSQNISPLSNSLSTIYLETVNDTCNGRIILKWSPFSNIRHPADSYDVFYSENGAPYTLKTSLPVTVTADTINGYTPSVNYCFFITAADNSSDLSSSNMQCVKSGMEKPPEWTEVVSVAVNKGSIMLTGSYDPSTDIEDFVAERYAPVTGTWESVKSSTGSGGAVFISSLFTDTGSVNLFRISPVNNCGNTVSSAIPVRNIVLESAIEGTEIEFRWNNPFPSESAIFSIWRNKGNGWFEIVSAKTDTVFSDDYSSFGQSVTTGNISYYVTGTRSDAPAGTAVCRSSVTFVAAIENVFIANTFTPDDNGVNDTFIPSLSFTPLSYDFRVFNRLGIMLFRTTNHSMGWDGRNGGTPVPAGAYLYTIILTSPSGQTIQRKGTVTILR